MPLTGTPSAVTPYRPLDGRTTYALEGSIFVAGAAVKWLRDGIGVITHASQTDDLATWLADWVAERSVKK